MFRTFPASFPHIPQFSACLTTSPNYKCSCLKIYLKTREETCYCRWNVTR